MSKCLKFLVVIACLFLTFQSKATHLIGGYFSYECLGLVPGTNEVEYVVRAVLFKDSLNTGAGGVRGAILENPLPVTLFGPAPNNSFLRIINMQQDSLVTFVDSGAGECVLGVPVISIILKGYYSDTVRLRRDQAHKYVWRRCCRNNPDNVVNPAFSGSTFFIDIPEFDQVGCNTSPQLVAEQPFSFCAGVDINLDLSATDPDGDVLVYELCAPFDFPRGTVFTQVPANSPPYPQVVFQAPATATNPIPSSPAITIDPQTGLLTGIPTTAGKYLIGFCVKEFNSNGVLLSTTIRDIQVKVDNCILQVTSAIQDQERFCDGLTIQFRNKTSSNADSTLLSYKWDFGVPGATNDTSRLREPLFVYPSPGFYNVTLIANPEKPNCRDTSITIFEVKPQLQTTINTIQANLCVDNTEVDFSVGGIFQPNATFEWDFGAAASVPTSTNQGVLAVQFTGQNSYPVELITTQESCKDTSNITINAVNNPTANFTVDDGTGCTPHLVNFSSTVSISGAGTINYLWDFGDGNTSTKKDPVNTYQNDGNYNVRLRVITTGDCKDTLFVVKNNLVQTGIQFSINNTDFSYTPSTGCFPLTVQFTNNSIFDGTATYAWDFGDGSPISTAINPIHEYSADGYYDVSLTMTTTGGCAQVLTEKIDSAVHVSLDYSQNVVDFAVNQTTGCSPVDIQFINNSFTEGAAKYTWFFGDGNTSELKDPLHTYQTDGIFDVKLILESTEKCIETIELTKPALIETDIKFSTNEVGFDYFPKEGCIPFTVQFSDSSKFLGTPRYFWDFGDGSDPNLEQNPTYVFEDTGRFAISLLLITSDKCVDTISTVIKKEVLVLPEPIAQINYIDTAKSLKEAQFQFTNSGSQFVAQSRYLVDGQEVGQDSILNFQFQDTGHFQVSYIAINSFGCLDTSTAEVFVFDEFQFIIPNVFTPNFDNVNDEFKVRACGVYDYEISIFNRFGEKMFTSNSLNINWDGRSDGKKVQAGTYFYTIKIRDFRNQILDYNGSLFLIRD